MMAEPVSVITGKLASTAGLLFSQFSSVFRRRRASSPANFEISTFHNPPNPKIDVVFVHGLGSNSSNAWSCTDGPAGARASWPATELPSRLQTEARILAYDYDTELRTVEYTVSRTLMHQTKRLIDALVRCRKGSRQRPIVFVCHGLGGIVVKNALVHARNNQSPGFGDVFDAVRGIVFLGTPHTNSPKALADSLRDALGLRANPSLYNELRNRATTLACSLERFKPLATSLYIYAITPTFLLPGHDSNLDKQPENEKHIYRSVDRGHAQLAKFSSRTDRDLSLLIGYVDDLCLRAVNGTARTTVQGGFPIVGGSLSTQTRAYDLGVNEALETHLEKGMPILHDSERERLECLEGCFHGWFEDSSSLADPDAWPIAILHGPPGSGKTQTALRYVSRHRHEYSSILWINATNRNSLGFSYREIARIMVSKYPESSQILGLDGISLQDDPEPGQGLNDDDLRLVEQAVMEWLARPDKKKWLLILDGLSPNSGYPLSPAWPGWLDKNPRAKDWWREFLANLPSTTGNRGHTIISTRSKTPFLGPRIINFTVPEENSLKAQMRLLVPNRRGPRSRFRDWWQTAEDWEKRTLEVALFLSSTNCPRIPIFLLERELKGNETTEAFTLEDLEIEGPYLCLSKDFLIEGPLLLSHQIPISDEELLGGTATIETEITDSNAATPKAADQLDKTIIEVLARAWKALSDGLQTIRNHRDLVVAWDDEEQVVRNTSTLLWRCRNLTTQHVLQQSLDEQRGNLIGLAAACEAHAEYKTARRLYNLERYRPHLQDEADFALRLNCARMYQRCGQYSEAEAQYDKIFSKHSELFERSKIVTPVDDRIRAYRQFALMWASRGKFDEAIKQLSQVLALEDPFGGDADQAQVTGSIGELALYLLRSGNERAASTSLQRVLVSSEQTRGKTHPATLSTMEMLSSVTLKIGQIGETLRLLNAVHKHLRDRLGEQHPRTVVCMSKIAAAMDLGGDAKNAEKIYLKCLEAAGECLGPRHPTVFSIRKDLAYCLLTLGKQAEAREQLEKLAHEFESSPDLYSGRVVDSINRLLNQKGDIRPLERDSDFATRTTLGIGGFPLEEKDFSDGESGYDSSDGEDYDV